MKLFVATANAHKIKEITAIMQPLGIEVLIHSGYGNLIVEETGTTFEANASIKALALSRLTNDYVIADDSGISVDSLDGEPGVYSARFAGEHASDEDNNKLLLEKLKGKTNRTAKYVCVIALAKDNKIIKTFYGECSGMVAERPYGTGGFGYDPLFVLENGKHMAELSAEEKNSISHRKAALNKLAEFFESIL